MLPRLSSLWICRCHRLLVTLHEHAFVQLRCAVLGGQQHTVARPGEASIAFVDVDAEVQCREPRHLPEFLRDELVERNRIAEAAFEGAARGGQQAVVGAVSAGDAGVREPAEDGEVAAEFGERGEIGRQLVVAPGGLRERRTWAARRDCWR